MRGGTRIASGREQTRTVGIVAGLGLENDVAVASSSVLEVVYNVLADLCSLVVKENRAGPG